MGMGIGKMDSNSGLLQPKMSPHCYTTLRGPLSFAAEVEAVRQMLRLWSLLCVNQPAGYWPQIGMQM